MDNIEVLALHYLIFNAEAIKSFITSRISINFFYNDVHKTIYKTMGQYYRSYGAGIPFPILKQELEKFYKEEYYSEILTFDLSEVADMSEKWIIDSLIAYKKTRLIKNGIEELIKKSDLKSIDEAQKQLTKLNSDITRLGVSNELVFDLSNDLDSHVESLAIPRQGTTVMTGFKQFDSIVHGLKPGWLTLLVARPKVGKCNGIDTPIVMYDGSIKKVQDIVVGDRLMGDDSSSRSVIGLARGRAKMYKINPNKGDSFTCNGDHILSLKKSGKRLDHGLPRILDISVSNYLKRKELHKYKLYRVGVDFKEKSVSRYLPPYLLGAWLGDGTSVAPEITSVDRAMLCYLKQFAKSVNGHVTSYDGANGHCPRHYISFNKKGVSFPKLEPNPVFNALRNLSLIKNKHIPDVYKINTRAVRLDVLAGLIDTDGYLAGETKNTYEIITKYDRLKDDILYLVRSLGFGATCRKCTKTIRSINFSGEYWRIFINGNISEIPVKIAYKKAKVKSINRQCDALTSGFTVQPIGTGDYYGFELDGNHHYLLGDFTVTHNSRTMVNMAVNMVKRGTNVLIFSIEVERDQYANLLLSCMGEVLYSKIEDHAVTAEDKAKFIIEQDKINSGEYGRLVVLDTGGMITPDYVKLKLEEMETSLGINFDVVMVDHASMMVPNSSTGADHQDQAKIAEDLKDLAREKRKVVITAVQRKQEASSPAKKGKDALSGEGAASRSDRWFQITDLLMIITNNDDQEEQDKNMFGTLKFKVISRFSHNFRFELLKDFSVTKLYSSDGNQFTSPAKLPTTE